MIHFLLTPFRYALVILGFPLGGTQVKKPKKLLDEPISMVKFGTVAVKERSWGDYTFFPKPGYTICLTGILVSSSGRANWKIGLEETGSGSGGRFFTGEGDTLSVNYNTIIKNCLGISCENRDSTPQDMHYSIHYTQVKNAD